MSPGDERPAGNEPASGEAASRDTLPLDRLANAHRFNAALFDVFRRAVGRRVLDAGAGVGTFTARILDTCPDVETVVAADQDPRAVLELGRRFAGQERVVVRQLDLERLPVNELAALRFDSVLCLNVLEHLEDDAAVLRAIRAILSPGARLMLLVPAHEALYGSLDLAFRHYRRYSRARLTSLLEAGGWHLERLHAFNFPGLLGWFLSSRLLGRRTISEREVRLFDRWAAPLLRWERRLRIPVGGSFAAVARAV